MHMCTNVCYSVCLFVFVSICVHACEHAAAFSRKYVPQLSGQVTHRGNPFSASLDPRPQPLCLLQMCPLCLVPYPIILCPCSKNPCSPIVLLTCSTLPIVRNTPCCLPSSLANFSIFHLVCSTSLLACLPPFYPLLFITFYPFLIHPNHFLHPLTSAFSLNKMISLFTHILHLSVSFLTLMG